MIRDGAQDAFAMVSADLRISVRRAEAITLCTPPASPLEKRGT
jgi:hypothetical protein